MLDYEKKYLQLTQLFGVKDISDEFPNANGFEKSVIAMRQNGWTYEEIQKKLGMPSKKSIRNVLLKWSPDLIDNSLKKKIEVSQWEAELYDILSHTNRTTFEFEGEDWVFEIIDHKINYEDAWGTTGLFHDLNDIMKQQILISIKNQLNGFE